MKFEQNISFLVHLALTVNFNFFHNTILKCSLTPFQTSHVFKCLLYKSVENTGKGIIALKEQFMFFQQCLLSVILSKLKFFDNFLPILSELKLLSAHSFSWKSIKVVFRKGLMGPIWIIFVTPKLSKVYHIWILHSLFQLKTVLHKVKGSFVKFTVVVVDLLLDCK